MRITSSAILAALLAFVGGAEAFTTGVSFQNDYRRPVAGCTRVQVRRSGARRPAAGRWDLASTGSCPGRPFAVVGKDAAQLHLGGIVPWRHGCGVRHGLAAPAPLGMRMCLGLQWTWGRIRRFNPPALAAGDAGYCRDLVGFAGHDAGWYNCPRRWTRGGFTPSMSVHPVTHFSLFACVSSCRPPRCPGSGGDSALLAWLTSSTTRSVPP